MKRENSLFLVFPIVSHGVVEEQRLQITCLQARLTEFRNWLRTESESSKQLAVAEQISTCKLSQTNPRSQSEEISVQQKEKSGDKEIVSLTEELQELQQQSLSFDKQRQEYETQLVQTVVTNQNRKLFKRKQKLLDSLNEANEELDEHMKIIQAGIDSTLNKAHSAENTSEINEEQMHYSLISEMAEKPDLVHETHWVNEPRQLHYVHQQKDSQSGSGMKYSCAKQNS